MIGIVHFSGLLQIMVDCTKISAVLQTKQDVLWFPVASATATLWEGSCPARPWNVFKTVQKRDEKQPGKALSYLQTLSREDKWT